MKVEPRGKYAGVKVHLEAEEAEVFMALAKPAANMTQVNGQLHNSQDLAKKVGKKILALYHEYPDLLTDKSEEKVAEVLVMEAEKANAKLKALKAGKDWTKVKG